jgi:hypothetical protein
MSRLPCLGFCGRGFSAPSYGSTLGFCATGRVECVAALPQTAARARRGGGLRMRLRLRSSMWRCGCRRRSPSALFFGVFGLWDPSRCRARSACPLSCLFLFLSLSFLLCNHTSPLHVFQFINGYLHHLLRRRLLFSLSSHRYIVS